MKLPKMYRKKRGGRHVGSWRAMVNGDEVNLGTNDAEAARPLLLAAVQRGRRHFTDEAAGAADLEGAAAAGERPPAPPDPGHGVSGQADHPAPAASPQLQQLPELAPANDVAEADDMVAAAADVAGAAANDNADAPKIDTEVLDAMLEQGASVIVDLQLSLQAYAIKRGTGLIAGAIPMDSELRTGAAKAWAQQLKIWFPSATALPPWAMALLLPAMALPAQFANARKPTPEELRADKAEEKPADPPMAAAQ